MGTQKLLENSLFGDKKTPGSTARSCSLQSHCWGFCGGSSSLYIVGSYCWAGESLQVCVCGGRINRERNCAVFLHPHQFCLIWHLRLCCSPCHAWISAGSGHADLGTVCKICPSFMWYMNWGLYGVLAGLSYHCSFSILWKGLRVCLLGWVIPITKCIWATQVLKCMHTV